MDVVRLGKFTFTANWLASVSLDEAKEQTEKNTPNEVIEKLWIEVNGKPKKEKIKEYEPEGKPKKKSKSKD